MNEIDQIVSLVKKHREGTLSVSDTHELEEYVIQYPFLANLLQEVNDIEQFERTFREIAPLYLDNPQDVQNRMWTKIKSHVDSSFDLYPEVRQKYYWKYALAASVLLVLALSFYMYNRSKVNHQDSLLQTTFQLEPGKNHATLTISGAEKIELNHQQEGIVMGNDITYADGSLLLAQDNKDYSDKTFLLTTPRGGQYQIVLPDGSKVWLNAESSIEYPAQFTGTQRLVKLNGEAYFEVAKKTDQRFVIETHQERIEVLGTHFNVNSYRTESQSTVSLVEGRVSVALSSTPLKTRTLQPGQQSVVKNDHLKVHNVNVDDVIAWKNGEFMFNNTSLEEVMRTLSRWYDFEYEIAPKLAQVTVWGSVSRYETFDKVLNVIKRTDESIQVKVQGRRISIMQ